MNHTKKIKVRPRLEPCPFCGAAPKYINEPLDSLIYCGNKDCYATASTGRCRDFGDAIRLWNRRKTLDTGK